MVKLTISQQLISINKFHLQLVSKTDYEKNAKILNKAKVDDYYAEEKKNKSHRNVSPESSRENYEHKKRDRKWQREGDSKDKSRDADRKRKYEDDKSESHTSKKSSSKSSSHTDCWLHPLLRVRIVDKHYRKGKYYNMKVEVVDVVTTNTCVCKTEQGKVLEDLSQSMVETVIPKADSAHVMIVSGKYKGQLGEIIKKDKSKCTTTVQLLSSRDKAVKLHFDSVCEYLGDVNTEPDF
ncbi:G-patch domain and KOW motifs-containing protein [Lingula anatina]|uniref:G-patch domain and KOW motifs-containing protein n=1 Tax=Lingula anatina TaxID=7574 RepID=A0A1S3JRX9_LINAN|nr:G-patch domain and KOW motifs-containing protein [Lingula anatina]|eukprot:XP_013412861.1 G-patch domain and KOW motifs-containing protein [Lingula anatina]